MVSQAYLHIWHILYFERRLYIRLDRHMFPLDTRLLLHSDKSSCTPARLYGLEITNRNASNT